MKNLKLKIGNITKGETPGAIYHLKIDGSNLILTRDEKQVDSISLASFIPQIETTVFRYRASETLPNISDDETSSDFYNGPNWKENMSDTNGTIWIASRVFVGGSPKERTHWTIVRYSGERSSAYSLKIEPSIIIIDVDLNKTYNLTAKAYKDGLLMSDGYELSWDMCGIRTTGVTYIGTNIGCEISGATKDIVNGCFISCDLKVDNTIVAMASIPFLRDSLEIISEFILANQGEWEYGKIYYNDTVSGEIRTGNSVKYIDVVYRNGKYYMPIVSKTTNNTLAPEQNPNEWNESFSLDFAYISNLITNVISTRSMLANEVLILNTDNEIVAGMTSGSRTGSDVRVWAGSALIATIGENGSVLNNVDVTSAPFKVYEDGRVNANNIIINGSANLKALYTLLVKIINSNISLLDFEDYNFYILHTESDITVNSNNKIVYLNNVICNNITLKKDQVYLLVNTASDYVLINAIGGLGDIEELTTYTKTFQVPLSGVSVNFVNGLMNITLNPGTEEYIKTSIASIEQINESDITSILPLSIVYVPKTYWFFGLKSISEDDAAGYLIESITNSDIWYDFYRDSKLYRTKGNTLEFNTLNIDSLDSQQINLYLHTDTNFSYQDNESSIYWFGDKNGQKYVFFSTLEGSNQPQDNAWEISSDVSLYRRFLEQTIKILIQATISKTVTTSTVMPNGTVINPTTQLVLGYINLNNNHVTSYSNNVFYLSGLNDEIYKIPVGTTDELLTDLDDIMNPDPIPAEQS